MEIVKSSHTEWFVITDTVREKRELFKIIDKRAPSAVYYHPDGARQEQFTVSVKEVDLVNEQICHKFE